MPSGTGLNILQSKLPKQFFDVGIAEEHAVLFAAGMATKGFKPICAIYSTFLQRAYDQIIHDVALQNLPVLFCIDRSGLSPNDGPTHHGLFDISYLRPIPNCTIMAPSNEDILADMIYTGLSNKGPSFIRYPRGNGTGIVIKKHPKILTIGKGVRSHDPVDIDIWALGSMHALGEELIVKLRENEIIAGLFDPQFIKPIDYDSLISSSKIVKLIVTIEDNVLSGGFGSSILEALESQDIQCPVLRIGWQDKFISHGSSVSSLRKSEDLDIEKVLDQIIKKFKFLDDRRLTHLGVSD